MRGDGARIAFQGLAATLILTSFAFLVGSLTAVAVPDGWAAWRVGLCFALPVMLIAIAATVIAVLDNL